MNKHAIIITSMPGEVDTSYTEYSLNTWKYWTNKGPIHSW